MNPFNLLTTPILNVLIAAYKVLQIIHIPFALGFAIIILSALIRLAFWRLIAVQLKSSQKMAALKPHLDRIKAEHGHDKVKHQQEVSKLYKEHGVNPMAGCLPLLVQLPVFIALSSVLSKITQFNNSDFLNNLNQQLIPILHLGKIPDPSFLGASLAARPSEWQHIGILILLVPPLTGLLQFIQSQMIAPQLSPQKTSGKKEGSVEDSIAQATSQMTYIAPLMFAFFSFNFSLGLSLYWNTFTLVSIAQQYIMSGPGGMNKYLPRGWRKYPIT